MTDTSVETDEYPPDQDDDQPQVPIVRAAGVRQRVLQTRPKQKKPKSVSKGGGRILSKEKQRKALELRKGGASYQAIADAVGYKDQSGARKAVLKAFADIIQEPVLELKTMQQERLNHMLLTLWPKVQQGDERAIDTSLRIMDKMDRLQGTEAAQQVDVNVHRQDAILVIDGSKEDFIKSMRQMAVGADAHKAIEAGQPSGQDDIVDAVLVEEHVHGQETLGEALGEAGRQVIHDLMAPSGATEEPDPVRTDDKPKKTYRFGVDPE